MSMESSGVLDKVKRLVGLGQQTDGTFDLSGINLPWHLARCNAALEVLIPLFRTQLFVRTPQERTAHYMRLLQITAEIIDSMTRIELFQTKIKHIRKEDPFLPCLKILYTTLSLLKENAVLGSAIAALDENTPVIPSASLTKFRALDDAASDSEVSLLHNAAELLESITEPLQKNMESRKRQLGKADLERYNRAFNELLNYYETEPLS